MLALSIRVVVEDDLGGRLHGPVLGPEGAVHLVLLLLDRGAEAEQRVGHLLRRLTQHVLQRARVRLVLYREERVRDARLAAAPRPADAMYVVLGYGPGQGSGSGLGSGSGSGSGSG